MDAREALSDLITASFNANEAVKEALDANVAEVAGLKEAIALAEAEHDSDLILIDALKARIAELESATEPPAKAPAGLGVYNGNPGEKPDETTISDFGVRPDVANSYYQPKESVNVAYETARIKRGTSPNLTMSTKGTQYIAGIASGDPAALAWMNKYVATLMILAAVDPTVPVYATLEHEYRAKVKQGLVTGASADPATYGKALGVFYAALAGTGVKGTYWIVGYDRAFETIPGTTWGSVGPVVIVVDPYANSGADTIATMSKADIDWIKAQPWFKGQPIAFGEFGMPVQFGDAAMAKFYTKVRAQLDALGVAWAVLFNRERDNNHKITTGAFPLAVSSFSEALKG